MKFEGTFIIRLSTSINPLVELRKAFNNINVGDKIQIIDFHRDLSTDPPRQNFLLLPDHIDPPFTFSLKHIIEEALNAICPQASNDLETPDLSGVAEGQGYWQLRELKIEGEMIIAIIKKL